MSNSEASVILLEFNELCPSLIHRFIGEGRLPNFKRFYEESLVHTTEAAERAPYVDPWIQWPTVHTGLNFAEHGIERLNEGHKQPAKRIWDLLSERGLRVWVCGSMSSNYKLPLNGHLMPDPWTTHVAPSQELEPFFRFVQRNVLEYTNKRVPITKADYLKFGLFLVRHGLSWQTTHAVVRQLIEERKGRGRWKRAMLLDKMQFDVFQHFYRRIRPHFATLFLNSTAHYQHFYWRNMEPNLFKVQPSEREQQEFGTAIQTGYEQMDRILGRMFLLAGSNVTLVLSTAISQEPYLDFENLGGKVLHRPYDFTQLFEFAGIAPTTFAPVMAHQFHVYFSDEAAALKAERGLLALRLRQEQLMIVRRTGNQLFSECRVYTPQATDAYVSGEAGAKRPFSELFYQVEGMRSGMHNPDGLLWIRRPDRKHVVREKKVPLAAIAPSLLSLLGIAPPNQMREKSLGFFGAELVNDGCKPSMEGVALAR
jgi:hypothetical protein